MLLEQLVVAYLRRKEWEAELLAVRVINTLGEAMGSGGGGEGYQRVSPDALLGMMGVE